MLGPRVRYVTHEMCYKQVLFWSVFFSLLFTNYINSICLQDLVVQREMATEEERGEMSKMCFWVADSKSAKLYSISTLMYHLVARSIEAAGLRKSLLTLREKVEGTNKFPTLTIDMERSKTNTAKYAHVLFPHRDTVLFDGIFAIAYVLVMDSNADSDFLFPDFAQKIHSGGKDINSKTANLFNHYADWLNNISYDYSEYSMMPIEVSLNSMCSAR